MSSWVFCSDKIIFYHLQGCSFGYHAGGWGKPPVDENGKPLYGDVFGTQSAEFQVIVSFVCSAITTESHLDWKKHDDNK